ncbi:hypothetical protein [Massilia yuzhufengensis]|uniref:Uncharacterized protein n=1 Tax=Massilia yuzhufengensis TaxID=1164594 RepID=A0A1I1VKT8_9BURK|nr:hypothetical protein [Massilia yuzhufengensis]SFD83616.1 hypothetical protein SAMN05216204_14025 [Massilia yuzhufengensis]
MAVTSADIKYRLSGGAGNTSAIASLGGAKSSQPASASLFDSVSGAEAVAGDTEYRCIYVHNASTTTAMANAVLWLTANTPSGSTDINVGLGTSAINGTEQTVANENTAPSGVTFTISATKASGLALGNIPPGQHRAVWLRRVVSGGAPAATTDTASIRVECEAG